MPYFYGIMCVGIGYHYDYTAHPQAKLNGVGVWSR